MKNLLKSLSGLVLGVVLLALSACGQFQRVAPGQSLGVAMARRPQVVSLPAPAPNLALASADAEGEVGGGDFAGPAVEPVLPEMNMNDLPSDGVVVEDPAAYLVMGDQLREGGDAAGAIAQYQDAVEVDPTFSLAWRNLALAYQEVGDEEKALSAFRKYKSFAGE